MFETRFLDVRDLIIDGQKIPVESMPELPKHVGKKFTCHGAVLFRESANGLD